MGARVLHTRILSSHSPTLFVPNWGKLGLLCGSHTRPLVLQVGQPDLSVTDPLWGPDAAGQVPVCGDKGRSSEASPAAAFTDANIASAGSPRKDNGVCRVCLRQALVDLWVLR